MQARAQSGEMLEAEWLAAMRRGDFASAWRVSDAVMATHDPHTRDDPRLPYHLRWVWDGRAFDGQDVLVRCYHGLGDVLMCARFLPRLRERAARVSLETPPELVRLLRTMSCIDRVLPFRANAPAPPAACDIEIMELAYALRVSVEELGPVPYLSVNRSAAAALRAQLGPGPAIGLCWGVRDWAPERSVPLRLMARAIEGLSSSFVSLQRGPAAAEKAESRALAFRDGFDRSTDLLGTAALLAALDAIVTVDTMIAHLAGALGRPVFLLLPKDANWRWMATGERTPWYPTARLFRQITPGDWSTPLHQLREALFSFRAED